MCNGRDKFAKTIATEIAGIMWGDFDIVLPATACYATSEMLTDNGCVANTDAEKVCGPEAYTLKVGPNCGAVAPDKCPSAPNAFYMMNMIMLVAFGSFYLGYPIYLFITGSGNWWGTTYDAEYLETLNGAKLSLIYRRYLMGASCLILAIAIWSAYEGLNEGASSFFQNFISGILTVLLALPPQRAKVQITGDVTRGSAILAKTNKGIVTKVRQVLMVNRCVLP